MSEFVLGRIDFEFALGTASAGESIGNAVPTAASAAAAIIDPSPTALQGTAEKEDIE